MNPCRLQTSRPSSHGQSRSSYGGDPHAVFRAALDDLKRPKGERLMNVTLTNDQAQRIARAAIIEAQARAALRASEGRGQRELARRDRDTVANAERALKALINEVQPTE